MRHYVRVEVVEETDLLRRVTVLNVALMRVLTGTRLVRLVTADYEKGCVEVVIEGAVVRPNPAPGRVTVEFLEGA